MPESSSRAADPRPRRARALAASVALIALAALGACGEGARGPAGGASPSDGLRPDARVDLDRAPRGARVGAWGSPTPPRAERVTERSLDLRGFSSVELAGPWTLRVTVGKPHAVTLEADERILALVTTGVTAGRLRIHIDEAVIRAPVTLSARVSLPSLDGLELSGAVDARVNGLIEVKQLNVVVDGRGVLRLPQVRVEGLTAVITGASRVEAAGEVGRLRLTAGGLIDVRLAGLIARAAEIGVAGEGQVNLHVTESLSGQIAGAAHVRVTGDPPRVVVEVMGTSRVLR